MLKQVNWLIFDLPVFSELVQADRPAGVVLSATTAALINLVKFVLRSWLSVTSSRLN